MTILFKRVVFSGCCFVLVLAATTASALTPKQVSDDWFDEPYSSSPSYPTDVASPSDREDLPSLLGRSVQFGSLSSPPAESCDAEGGVTDAPGLSQLIRKTGFNGTWLLSGGDEALNVAELSASSTLVVPIMLYSAPLLVTPSATFTLLDGPDGFDVPSELYRFSASLMWMKPINERWNMMLGVTPGISSDLDATDNAFRVFALGAATYQSSPTLLWTLGAAYTGRNDIPVLPLLGVTWTPTPDTKIEIASPRPKISQRVFPSELLSLFDPNIFEHWIYLAGELGGGTWAVRRSSGLEDQLTLRDFRVLAGYEIKTANRFQSQVEVGYVFAREFEYEDDDTHFEPSDAVLIRLGVSF